MHKRCTFLNVCFQTFEFENERKKKKVGILKRPEVREGITKILKYLRKHTFDALTIFEKLISNVYRIE